MSDDKKTDTTPDGEPKDQDQNPEGQEPDQETDQGTDDTGSDDQGTGDDGDELDADALRSQLTGARKDAAKYRTKNRELTEALAKAKSPEDFQAVADRAAQAEAELNRERAARKFQLPEELVEYLKGDTAEELEESAKRLSQFASRPGPTSGGGGGLDPSDKPTPTSPADLAAMVPRARR